MAWLILLLAGAFEVVGAITLKQAAGFTRLAPSLLTLAAMAASVALLGVALRTLPLSLGYALWTGLGTLGTVLFGVLVLGEPADLRRLLCVALIMSGMIGLKLLATDAG
jgi:quaternary ammonium compound-resistance protein SugE